MAYYGGGYGAPAGGYGAPGGGFGAPAGGFGAPGGGFGAPGGGAGVPPGGNVFGGFPGGYGQTPAGAPNANLGSSGAVYTMGMNLPKVDPNNFSGAVHFGPPSFVGQGYGQLPPGAGGFGSNLGGSGPIN